MASKYFRLVATTILVLSTLPTNNSIVHATGEKLNQNSTVTGQNAKNSAVTDSAVSPEFAQIFTSAQEDFAKKNYLKAEQGFSAAIAIDPQSYEARYNRALALYNLVRFEDALAEAKKAHEIKPSDGDAILLISDAHQFLGRVSEAIDASQLFLQKYPQSPMGSQVRAKIGALQAERLKLEATKADVSGEDYFNSTTYDSTCKWPTTKFPLKVFIPPDSNSSKLPNFKPEFSKILRTSFDEWQTRSNGLVSFSFVDAANKADIECEFVALTNPIRANEGGQSVRSILKDGIANAKIFLIVNTDISDISMKTTCLHEIGHTIGLDGHSPNRSDIMFFSIGPTESRDITARDIKTLTRLYQPDVKVGNHIHQSIVSNDLLSLNNEGLRLIDVKDFVQAAAKFRAILKADPQCQPAKNNLAKCFALQAVEQANSGHLAEAVENCKKALNLTDNKRNRIIILHNLSVFYGKMQRTADANAAKAQEQALTRQ